MANTGKAAAVRKGTLAYRLLNFKELSVIVAIAALMAIGVAVNPNFMNRANWWALFRTASFMGIVAVPVAFLLMTKSMDLSVGQVVASSSIIFATLCCKMHVPVVLAAAVTLLFGALVGTENGVLIVDVGVPSFLVTLSMQFILFGIASQMVQGVSITGFPDWFPEIGAWKLFDFVTVEMLVFLLVGVIGIVFLSKTAGGQQLLLAGTNDRAAELCGIRVKAIRRTAHILTSLAGALAAILFCARTGQASSGTGGEWDLQLMIAAMIGGTSNYGGRGSVVGTMLGIVYIRILLNVLIMLGLRGDWQFVGMGVSMILAILFDYWRTRVTMTELS